MKCTTLGLKCITEDFCKLSSYDHSTLGTPMWRGSCLLIKFNHADINSQYSMPLQNLNKILVNITYDKDRHCVVLQDISFLNAATKVFLFISKQFLQSPKTESLPSTHLLHTFLNTVIKPGCCLSIRPREHDKYQTFPASKSTKINVMPQRKRIQYPSPSLTQEQKSHVAIRSSKMPQI